jgi:hypothetical protein
MQAERCSKAIVSQTAGAPGYLLQGGLNLGTIYRQLLQLKNGPPQPNQFGR